MNWYKKAQEPLILWHATIPSFAREIMEDGFIRPSSQLGEGYAGWDDIKVPDQQYGDLVFLETNQQEAITYVDTRLDMIMSKFKSLEELLSQEKNYRYVVLFKIIVGNLSSDKLTFRGVNQEYFYKGVIPNRPNLEIYFENYGQINRDALWQKHVDRLNNVESDII